MARTNLTDETWVPLKWIYTIIGSCAVSVCTIVGAVWYVGSLAAREDVTAVQMTDLKASVGEGKEDRRAILDRLDGIDGRLSRIEGFLGRKRDR